MLFIALTLLGYVSYRQLPVELLPNAELPRLYVNVSSGGTNVDPAYMESQAVSLLEGAISTIDGVEGMRSVSGSTYGRITVDFKSNVNLRYTTLKLQEKINAVTSELPTGFTIAIQKADVVQVSNNFMVLQVRGTGGVDRVRNITDNDIAPELENIDGVASVNVYGGRQRALEVQLDTEAAKALNLTATRISGLLTQSTQDRTFVGYVNEESGNLRYYVHVNSVYDNVSEIENIVVAPGPILLKDIATIFFDLKEETTLSRVNGRESVSITVVNDAQANLIKLSERVAAVVERLNSELEGQDVEIVVQTNSAETMRDNIKQITDLALIGGLLAIAILWVFLKNIRLVVIIGLSIPISVYAAFNLFYYFGISINSLTLVGMALAIGMLLDNSIVVLENIYRLSSNGFSPEKAVTQGTKEVWRSIFAATLTTITVFLPFVFSDNYIIKLIGQHIGVSIISTLAFSLLVALLFVPMATYVILKRNKGKNVFYEQVSIRQRPIQIYLVLLKSAMRHPGATISGAIIVFILAYILSSTFIINTVKEVDTDRFNIGVTMFSGTSLEATDQMVRVMEERLEELPEKQDVVVRVQEQQASITVILQEDYKKKSKRSMSDIMAEVQETMADLQGVSIRISAVISSNSDSSTGGLETFMRMLGVGQQRERLIIRGSDYETMELVSDDIRYYMSEMESITNTSTSYQGGRQPEINLDFDPILLNSYEISRNNISDGLRTLNQQLSTGTQLKLGDTTYDIVIRDKMTEEEEERAKLRNQRSKTVDDLRAVQIESTAGSLYDLQSLASINYGRGVAQIIRVDQDKQIEIYYTFGTEAQESNELLESYRQEVDELVAGYNLPVGIAIEVVHEEDEYGDFKFLIIAAFIFIFMILASVFESVTTPFILMFSIPLAAIGSLFALWVTGNSLMNANTLTGFLILLGVVVNNGIILIDYSNILRKRGYNRNRALMTAGLARLRPIIITTVTTIVAMIPLAMGNTEYAGAIGAPFAITVIGGLATSALLTLIFIPTVALWLENTLAWYRSLNWKVKVLHLAILAAGIVFILIKYRYDGPLWQTLYLLILVVLIPAVTYFIQKSFRSANSSEVAEGDEIHIRIRNLVKIYDWPGRFARQWQSGLNIRRHMGIYNDYHKLSDFKDTIWQVVILGCLIYFTYFYLNGGFWVFLMSFAIYFFALYLWSKVRSFWEYKSKKKRAVKVADRIVFWGLPVMFLVILYRQFNNVSFIIVIGLIWGLALIVRAVSDYLYNNDINIDRVEGRFGGFKRQLFRIVKSIPLIGKRRKPFKALKGVSCDIRTGMFGLLGPNGAGKSTMMRIITGILDQSYGTIWINGLDTKEYREELQGLIGFLPQEFGTYENMTSWEFLDYQAILKGVIDTDVRNERLEYVLKAVHMYDRKDAKIGSFSGGMKQRIGIAMILLNLPKILVVDEPTAGLDPRERIRFRNLLVELSRERIVIFSTHIIEDIASSCSQVVVINRGELKYFGVPQEMIHFATGKVWQFTIPEGEFEEKMDKSLVVHHIQNENSIRVRYISVEKPYETAVNVEPNLEDAYLCLLKNM